MGKCKDCVVGLFGSCGRNADYCRLERETLMEEARLLAKEHGHVLGEFVQVKELSIWQAHCAQCDQLAFIDIDPAVDNPPIYGEATTVRCPAAEEIGLPGGTAECRPAAEDDDAPWDRPLGMRDGKQ